MEKFETFKGIVAPLDRANVDTDQIIAKQFLKSIKRTGFGESLFYDWRFSDNGQPNPDFSLNDAKYQGTTILLARNNFGCGSSREHAVWAIAQYGFKVIIAPSMAQGDDVIPGFADIFRNNCGKNGILTIELSAEQVDQIFALATGEEALQATVDLENQKLICHSDSDITFDFEISGDVKERLLKGLDDIGITLENESSISYFESRHDTRIYSS